MEEKILKFERKYDTLINLAEKKADGGDYISSLSFLFSALEKNYNTETLKQIALNYGEMGLYDYSNKFWFKYIDIAKKSELATAYEQLGINYFYLDNLWASGYYFNQKMQLDGFIRAESLDDEIMEFLSNATPKKSMYRVVYPYSRADYSDIIKKAKSALVSGNYLLASKIFKGVPYEVLTEENCGDVATSFFLSEMDEDAISVCKYSLEKFGENVTAYCNLSTIYLMKENKEKSRYYYDKANEIKTGKPEEYYKIATCAIEQNDNEMAKKCFSFILSERPYDSNLRFFFGISLINLGEYDEAFDNLSMALRISPDDYFINYYVKLLNKIKGNDSNAVKSLPLKYTKELPDKVIKDYKKKLKEVAEDPLLLSNFIKRKANREILRYGLNSIDPKIAKYSAYILSLGGLPFCKQYLEDFLLAPEGAFEIKRYVIFAILLNGRRESFGAVGGNIYEKIKPRPITCMDKPNGLIFMSAYANAMSRICFTGITDTDKIAFFTNVVAKKFIESKHVDDFLSEEYSALIIRLCGFREILGDSSICRIFNVKKERLTQLVELFEEKKEENDDKNN